MKRGRGRPPEPKPIKVTDGIKDWAKEADRELEIVQGLYKSAVKGDVTAGKFLLTNLWPQRWHQSPAPTKRSPIDATTAIPADEAGAEPLETIPDRPKERPPGQPEFTLKLA